MSSCGPCSQSTMQFGGGCMLPQVPTSSRQTGGAYKVLPQKALDKASIWRNEVKQVQQELKISYRDALKEASKRRQAAGDYKTSRQRYVQRLDATRKTDREYR